MEMGVAKACGFLATSVLPLILLVHSTPTYGLKPAVQGFKTEYCRHEILIKGTYQKTYKGAMPSINDFKITQVFRGPKDLKKDVKINKAGQELCFFHPDDVKQKEFVIGGTRKNGQIMCSISQWWYKIKRGKEAEALKDISSNGCK